MHDDDEKDLRTPSSGGAAPGNGDARPENEVADAAAALPASPAASELADKLATEKQELFDRLLRKQAEFDNFRKRAQKEKEELRQHAAEEVIRSLLPILDGFERALQHRAEGVPDAYYQGMELIYRQMQETLGRAGLTAIDAIGQDFDPHLHQAAETVVAPDRREHEIVEQLQRGYRLKQRLLRPAMVKVAVKARQKANSAGDDDTGLE